ncbi:MAG: hypothetical protein FJ285_01870 [Planctomycetes bacterium]|nr:hypothetical protein [Planctomycetota bacterium]
MVQPSDPTQQLWNIGSRTVNAPKSPHPRAEIIRAQIDRATSTDSRCFALVPGNPQSAAWRHPPISASASTPWLCWSGSLASQPFAPDPRNWMRVGQEAFQHWTERLAAECTAGSEGARPHAPCCAVLPHHAQLLSDLSGQMRLWHQYGSAGIGSVLHPAALIAPSMLRDLEDHLLRAFTMLGSRCILCILQDIEPVQHDGEIAEIRLVPWGSGQMPHALVERLLNEHVPAHIPLCVPGDPLPT